MSGAPRSRLLILLLLLALIPLPLPAAAQDATPDSATDDQLEAVLPEYREDLGAVLERGLTAYTIEATLSEETENGLITGSAQIDYVNDTGEAIEEIPLRLYMNGVLDVMTLTGVEVAGAPVEPELSVYNSVATLPLEEPLAFGDRLEITVGFELIVPFGNQVHYGILGIDEEEQTWALAHWYPLVAPWVEGDGWMLDAPSMNGDPIFSTTSRYDVTITAPEELVLVTTGVEASHEVEDGVQTARFVSGPARDFTIVADDDYELTTIEVDGTKVNSWYLPTEAVNGEAIAQFAAQGLAYFNEAISPYPFTELDVVSTEVYGALGVEFPQLVYMARSYYTRDVDLTEPSYMEFTTVHEVLHQWFYSMVGSNQYDHAFIDEGLTNYVSGDLYFRHIYGDEAGRDFSFQAFRNSYQRGRGGRGDRTVDKPTDEFPGPDEYVYAMYAKGAYGFSQISDEIGEEAFLEGLSLYVERTIWGVATPEDLLDALEDASGQELDELWHYWFVSDEGTQ